MKDWVIPEIRQKGDLQKKENRTSFLTHSMYYTDKSTDGQRWHGQWKKGI